MRSTYFDIILDPIGCEECSPNVFSTYAACGNMKIGVLEKSDKKAQCPEWMRKRFMTGFLKYLIKIFTR